MAVKTIYEMYDLVTLKENTDIDIDVVMDILATDKWQEEKELISSESAKRYIIQKYATRQFPVLLGRSASLLDAKQSLQEVFNLYITNHQYGINKQFQALFDYDYSPIENVDRYETETTNAEKNGTDSNTRTNNLSHSTTYGRTSADTGTIETETNSTTQASGDDKVVTQGDDTLTRSGAVQNVHNKSAFNAPDTMTQDTQDIETYQNYTEDTVTGATETTTHGRKDETDAGETRTLNTVNTLGGSDTTRDTGTVTDAGTTAETNDIIRDLRVHGNIGVTSNVDLISQELELRKMSLAEMILDDFINTYTYYS